MVTVGIYQNNPDPAAPGLADGTDFGLYQLPVKFVRFRCHQTVRYAVRNGARELLKAPV